MRTSRLHFEGPLATSGKVILPADSAHYLQHVLRLKAGDEVNLFNDANGEFLGCITSDQKNKVEIELHRHVRSVEQPSLTIRLAVGMIRGDRMDFAIQKSTELGVSSITPLYTEHGEIRIKQSTRLENKLRHWRKIAVSASEQCGRLSVPSIRTPQTIVEWLETAHADFSLLMDPTGTDKLAGLRVKGAINLITGPEGGFSEEELKLARAKDYSIVGLGQRILRAETAPIVALSILQNLYGDIQGLSESP